MTKPRALNRLFRFLLAAVLLTGACNLLSHLGTPAAPTATPLAASPGAQASPTGLASPGAPQASDTPSPSPTPPVPLSQGPRFAVFEESPGDVSPLLRQDDIAPDLSNVSNPFLLSKSQLDHLARDGFVVSPGAEKEFFSLYEKARYNEQPVFVTSDSLLHSYHLLFDKVLRTAELERFIPLLQRLNQAMLAQTDAQYQALVGTAWEEPARRAVAFFGVGSRLLDLNVAVPSYAADLVQQELALIDSASGIQPSPIFPGLEYGEDYTQYIPRGHYTKTESLKAYFKSMMWYGRMTFLLMGKNPEVGKADTRVALLVTHAIRNTQVDGKPATDAWADLYAPTVFFVGRSDDLTVVQYGDVMNVVYGPDPSLQAIADDAKLDQFISLANQLPPPRILGIVIDYTDEETQYTKGLRFMGQRFVPDAYIFRQLIFRNVGTLDNRRGLPKGLDLMAAMGSERAYQHLESMGDTAYENYVPQMDKVKSWLFGLTVPEWTETLYNTWLYSFYPLLDTPGEGYPKFMQAPAWLDKQLNAALGSWAELKHDTILYAKQVYAELGGGPPPPPPLPPKNYVEPVPHFYARLTALTAMTRTGLESRGLLNEADKNGLVRLEDLSRAFQTMAEKELRGEPLTADEQERIRYYGGELEQLVFLSADMDTSEEGAGSPSFMTEDQQAAVIADVATDPGADGGPQVLEVGVGRIFEIHVVAPIVADDGSTYLQVCKGGVFSYYEFPWPASDRLTDESWRAKLDAGQAPAMQPWTASFLVSEGEYADLTNPIISFQKNIVYDYWDPQNMVYNLGPAEEFLRPELEALNAQQRYVGHQLVGTNFRSFDLQASGRAVVTARETWQDKMYSYSGYPTYEEPAIAQRGPYTLDVTYILQIVEGTWAVVQVNYSNQPPGW